MSNEKSIESQEQEVAEYYLVGYQIQESQLALQKESSLSYQQLSQLPDCFGQMNMTSFKFWKVVHEILAHLPFYVDCLFLMKLKSMLKEYVLDSKLAVEYLYWGHSRPLRQKGQHSKFCMS